MTTQQTKQVTFPGLPSNRPKVSFNPENMAEGGLPLDKVDAKWTGTRFEVFTYRTKEGQEVGRPSISFGVDFVFKDQAGEDKTQRQQYSVGSTDLWGIESDGQVLVPLRGEGQEITKTSNFAALTTALRACGFPPEFLDLNFAGVFNGLVAHMEQRPQPEREGLSGTRVDSTTGQERVRTHPLPTQLRNRPTEQGYTGQAPAQAPTVTRRGVAPKPVAPAPAPAPTAPVSAAATANGAIDPGVLVEIMSEALADKPLALNLLRIKVGTLARARSLDPKVAAQSLKTEDDVVALGDGVLEVVEEGGKRVIRLAS